MYGIRMRSHHDAMRRLKHICAEGEDKAGYLERVLGLRPSGRKILYLHVPFCNKICSFCSFHRPDAMQRRTYHAALVESIKRLSGFAYMRTPFSAVNFGGGTPTALPPEGMAAVLDAIRKYIPLEENAEFSVESSVSELTDDMLGVLRAGGVNRLSIGVQTFDEDTRRLFNRRGSGEKARERLASIVKAIPNTSIDLIYNYPGQTDDSLARDLDIIASLGLAGISFYALMIHEKTPLARRLTEAQLSAMRDLRREKELFLMIVRGLAPHGFAPMELTKLVRDGIDRYDYIRIRHSGGNCVPVGLGAGGNIENYFFRNSSLTEYVSPSLPFCPSGRVLSDRYRVIDSFAGSMQTLSADLSEYSARLGADLPAVLGGTIDRLTDAGLVTYVGGSLGFTEEGMFWGNNIIDELLGVVTEAGIAQ